MKKLNEIAYEVCPPGSPDKFRLTEDAVFKWTGCPRWIWEIVTENLAVTGGGYVIGYRNTKKQMELAAKVPKGFYFAVSVAPNFRRARGGACLHDFMYENAAFLAEIWDVPRRTVLHIADHWFLANMRAADFLLKRTYFVGVRVFGFWFNSLFGGKKRAA